MNTFSYLVTYPIDPQSCPNYAGWAKLLPIVCQTSNNFFKQKQGQTAPLIQPDQYGISFLGLNVHPWHIFCRERPISHCAANIWICSLYESSQRFKQIQFKSNFLCTLWMWGLVPIHYKYFLRNLILHHFLLSPEVWNMHVPINLTRYTLSKLAGHANTMQYSRTLEYSSASLRVCHSTCKIFTGLNVPCLWYYTTVF